MYNRKVSIQCKVDKEGKENHFAILPRFHRYIPNMLHRLGIGIVLVFFQELAEMVIVLAAWEDYGTCSSLITNRHSLFLFAPIGDCMALTCIL